MVRARVAVMVVVGLIASAQLAGIMAELENSRIESGILSNQKLNLLASPIEIDGNGEFSGYPGNG